jgi:hypothetical protein
MGSIVSDIGDAVGGVWNDVTGKTSRDAQSRANSTQDEAKNNAYGIITNAQGTYDQGTSSTKSASDFWNKWLDDPTSAYNSTLGTAQNTGAANAGMATNSAVNSARGSGLNAGQAALSGGAQAANSFTENTQNAQNNLMNQQQTSAQGQSQQGINQQNTGLNAQNTANNTIAGNGAVQQQNATNQKQNQNNLLGGITGGLL